MVKDNSRIVFGNSGDLSIRHLSSDNTSYVSSTTNNVTHEFNKTKTWTLTTTAAEKRIHCPADGTSNAVELYHNGARRFHTKSEGVAVEGSVNLEGSQATLPSHGGMTRHTNAYVYFTGKSDGNGAILSNGDGTATFRALNPGSSAGYVIIETGNGDTRLTITSDGHFGTNGVTPTTQAGKVFHLHAGAAQQRFHMTNATTGSGATDGFEIIVEQSANTRIRNFEAGDMAFDTGGSNNEVMRITSAGMVMIGETSVAGGSQKLVIGQGGAENFEFTPGTSSLNGGVLEYIHRGDSATRPDLSMYVAGGDFKVYTDGSERVRILGDSNTCNLKLVNAANADASATCEIQANHDISDSSKIVFGRENANDWSASWASQHSFLSFHTFNGSSNLGERMRIDSKGNLLVGTTTEGSTNTQITVANGANAGITIRSGTSSWGCLYFSDATSGADEYRGAVQYNQPNDYMMIRTATVERMRITASGSFYVTTTSSHAAKHAIHSGSTVGCAEFASALGGAGAACQVNVRVNTSASQGLYIRQGGSSQTIAGGNHCARFWNSEDARMQFGVNNTERFRIESNGDLKATDTTIGSLSDSRLKKNIADFTYDLTKFKQFKPRTFDWINPELHSDNTGIRGFVAQEIETVDSSLVGDYELFDETEDTKNPDLEIIKADDGTNKAKDAKLGSNDAMYISVIQQLITKIETLEAEVAALKSA